MGFYKIIFLIVFSLFIHQTKANDYDYQTFFTTNGTLNSSEITLIPFEISMTGIPGQLTVIIQSGYSISICISPNAYVTVNSNGSLKESCPRNLYWHIEYGYDFSYSSFISNGNLFMGNFFQKTKELNLNELQPLKEPQTLQERNFTLLQNVPYYISIGFENATLPTNTSLLTYQLSLARSNLSCNSFSVPLIILNPNEYCKELDCRLSENTRECIVSLVDYYNYNYDYEINKETKKYKYISVNVSQLTSDFSVILEDIDDKSLNDIEIYIAYGRIPQVNNSDYSFNKVRNFTIINPIIGTYYIEVISPITDKERYNFVYIPGETCTITESTNGICGNNEYEVLGSKAINKVLNETTEYLVIPSTSNMKFGITILNQGNSSDNSSSGNITLVTILTGINYFPSLTNILSGISRETIITNGTFYTSLATQNTNTTNQNNDYIIAINGLSNTQVLIWQGSYCPENCNSHGNCSIEHVCSCEDKYEGDFCENTKSKLPTLYLILIIVGCAVLLATIIGISIGVYFMKTRKYARYERV